MREYQKKYNDFFAKILASSNNELNYLSEPSNIDKENGRDVANSVDELNGNFNDLIAMSSIKSWFDQYYLLSDNMQAYAPNLKEHALDKFILETPLNFHFRDMEAYVANSLSVFKEIFADDLDDKIINQLKESISDAIATELDFVASYSGQYIKYSMIYLFNQLEDKFYTEKIGIDLIEITKENPERMYTMGLFFERINFEYDRAIKSQENKDPYPFKIDPDKVKACEFLKQNQFHKELESQEEDYLRNLSNEDKSKEYIRTIYLSDTNREKFDKALSFMRKALYIPNENETINILNTIPKNNIEEKNFLTELFEAVKRKTTLEQKMFQVNKDNKKVIPQEEPDVGYKL